MIYSFWKDYCDCCVENILKMVVITMQWASDTRKNSSMVAVTVIQVNCW